ncbi:unnamed protein product [Alopecurus aequalis]
MIPSPALLHAAWITAAVAVCLALCTIHSRKTFSSVRRGSSRPGSARGSNNRPREANAGGAVAATLAAKVSPTPSPADTAKSCCVNVGDLHDLTRVGDEVVVQDGPVTVIDVGTHGPIAPVFPVPDPMPPRRSLSVKNIRLERLVERIRSRRWGAGDDDDDEEAGQPDDATLWNKTILLGERCRVSSGDEAMGGTWKSYRPRQPRSVPVTRSNSFAGVVDNRGGSCRPAGGARL